MNKPRKTMLMVIAALVGTAVLVFAFLPSDYRHLTDREIEVQREKYPVNDYVNPLMELVPSSLESYIDLTDSIAVVELLSSPVSYIKKYEETINGSIHVYEWDFMKCEVRIVEDVLGTLSSDTLTLTYNAMFSDGMPEMKPGARFLLGGILNPETQELSISRSIMYYVTDTGHVLSVESEESKNRHTGSTVTALKKYIIKTKNASKE